jgi:N-acetylglucosaminyldiphosphoundecaprenol N-acetyl-beta-D-mannosaminyltransferase
LERIFKEPKKQLKRVFGYMLAVPKMYFDEKRKAKASRQVKKV